MSTKKRISLLFLFLALFSFLLVSQAAALEYIPDSVEKIYLTGEGASYVVSSQVDYSYADGIYSSDVVPVDNWRVYQSAYTGYLNLEFVGLYDILLDSNVDGGQVNGGQVDLSVVLDFGSGYDFDYVSNAATVIGTRFRLFTDMYFGESNTYYPITNFRVWANFTGNSSDQWYLISSNNSPTPNLVYYLINNDLALPIDSTPLWKFEFSFTHEVTPRTSFRIGLDPTDSFLTLEKSHFRENVKNYLDEYLNIFGEVNFPDPPDLSYLSLTDINFDFFNRFLINDQNTYIFDSSGSNYFQIFLTSSLLCLSIGLLSFTVFGIKR